MKKKIQYVHIIMVNNNPVNYGKGYAEFIIKPQFFVDKIPQYYSDFKFNMIIYFSNIIKEEFQKTLKYFGNDIIFHNYENDFINKQLNNKKIRECKLKRILEKK
jgi:hypothetical protein